MNYNVYIVAKDRSESWKVASEVSERRAERVLMGALMQCDRDRCFVGDYEVGSEEDKEIAKLIK